MPPIQQPRRATVLTQFEDVFSSHMYEVLRLLTGLLAMPDINRITATYSTMYQAIRGNENKYQDIFNDSRRCDGSSGMYSDMLKTIYLSL